MDKRQRTATIFKELEPDQAEGTYLLTSAGRQSVHADKVASGTPGKLCGGNA